MQSKALRDVHYDKVDEGETECDDGEDHADDDTPELGIGLYQWCIQLKADVVLTPPPR